MQFYRDGYRPGDPEVHPPAPEALARREAAAADGTRGLPREVDVLIVGTGPAGTVLGAQLAAFPQISTLIVERRGGPLQVGQADGVACRTVEMFQAFGLAEGLIREAYWVNEVHFWGPSEADRSRIERTGWVLDTPPGLSEFPHVIVNQARMQQYLLDHMKRSPSRLEPAYGLEVAELTVDDPGDDQSEQTRDRPVTATLRDASGSEITVRARYVVGCDGARSNVRRAIGRRLRGDAANHAWGVIDVLANTDFPGWRTKNVVQSVGKGSLLMIPREGGTMVRLYVDLGEVPAGDQSVRATSAERLVEVANGILHPYSIDVRSVAWSSVYEVGQRVADAFDDGEEPGRGITADGDGSTGALGRDPHVFIAGDACHTHSAKAGQGMNVSMQDAFNLGWKLAAVLTGRAPESLLRTYSEERQAVAQDLIDFDKHWSAFIAQPQIDPAHPEAGGVTAEEMREQFARQGRYTAGLATRYTPSVLTGDDRHQCLAGGFEIGTRFHSSPVIRVADGRRVELGHVHEADGRFRIYLFGNAEGARLRETAQWLGGEDSPIAALRRESDDIDAVVDVRAIVPGSHHDVDVTDLPEVLLPHTGPLGLQDWEKVFAANLDGFGGGVDIFTARGIDPAGAMVVVRPDQYIGTVLPLDAREELTAYLTGILISPAA